MGQGSMGIMGMVLYFGALFAIFYFLLIRPQRKRQRQTDDMQNSINVGDWVMTTGGLFGKVVDIFDLYLVVEFGTNKSVLVPISRSAVASVGEPDLTKKRVEESKPSKKAAVADDDDDEFDELDDIDFDENEFEFTDEDFLDDDEDDKKKKKRK